MEVDAEVTENGRPAAGDELAAGRAAPAGAPKHARPTDGGEKAAGSVPQVPVIHMESPAPRRRGRRGEPNGRGKRFAARVVACVVVLAALVVAAGAAWVRSLDSSMSVPGEEGERLAEVLRKPESTDPDPAFYMAIIGSDSRAGVSGDRADVTMLARVDLARNTVTLVSIPRDTMVSDGAGGVRKINAAFNGGPAATVEAVSEFAGVPVTHAMAMSFDDLAGVVDELGGVTVDVPAAFTSREGFEFRAGTQTLSGEQAFSYVRDRFNQAGGDFGRAQAQRQVVEAIARKALSAPATRLPGVVESLAGSVTTDLTVSDLVGWATRVKGSGIKLKVYSAATPSYTLEQGGVSYVGTMYDEWRDMMRRVDAGLDPNDSSASIPEPQASDETLGAATNAASPADYRDLAARAGLTTDDVAE